MARIGCQQRFNDGSLGCLVYLGDEVVAILAGDLHRFDVETGSVDQSASLPGGAHGDIEHRMHDGMFKRGIAGFYNK